LDLYDNDLGQWNSGKTRLLQIVNIQTSTWAFSGLIRCVRLYLIYNITKEKFLQEQLRQENNEDNSSKINTSGTSILVNSLTRKDFNKPSRWWLNPKYLHWGYMYALFFILVAIFQVFPLATMVTGLELYGEPIPVSFCKTPAGFYFFLIFINELGRSGSIGALICLAILIVIIGYSMRGVHDAYFMKKELNLLAFESLFISLPSLTTTFITVI
jgi:hypothetical protein